LARIFAIGTLGLIDRILAPLTWVAAALVVVLLLVGPSLVGADKEQAASPAAAEAKTGAQVFADSGCASCHTLKAAGASGAIGPNLDETNLDAAAIENVVTGGRGSMPSFGGQLSDAELKAVAAYVASGGKEEVAATATPPAAASDAQVEAVNAGRGPDGITVGPDGTLWVANATAGTLARIPPGGDGFAPGPVAVGRQPDSPVVAGKAVWLVSSGDGDAVVVRDGEATKTAVGREPSALAIEGGTVWVANGGDGTVTRIDRGSGEVTGQPIRVGGQPADIAVADGEVWISDFENGTVTRIDASSGKVDTDPVRVGRRPRGIAIGDGTVWVANAGDGTVTRIDASSAKVDGEPIEVGENPREVAIGGGAVWVANAGDDTVTRIDPATGKVSGDPIEVGEDPIGIAAGDDAVWTSDFRGDTVTKITP
jgi:YVTN family beta-propeller protein